MNDLHTVNMPFIPTRFRLNESTILATDEECPSINSLKLIKQNKEDCNLIFILLYNLATNSSNSIGAPTALNTSRTHNINSGPTPSPGTTVT